MPDVISQVSELKSSGAHFSGISCFNAKGGFGLVYHFILAGSRPHDIKITFKRSQVVRSIAAIYPSAYKYETEAHEMFGVKFDRLKQEKFYLPDDWPKGKFPLSEK